MNADNVVWIDDRLAERDDAYWGRHARILGFSSFEALARTQDEAFSAALSQAEANCTHPEKLTHVSLCAECANKFHP